MDGELFQESISHYKNQRYGIAIDDVGSGFSGLNAIVDVKPRFIKLDMHLIRNIDKDETKLLLCKALTDFRKSAGIELIAEGIESEEELHELIRLGVDYGQGYFLALPKPEFQEVNAEKLALIGRFYAKHYKERVKTSVCPLVEHLCKPGCTFAPDERAEEILEVLAQNPAVNDFTVLEDNRAIGFMTRAGLNIILGGRYGYSLHSGKSIRQIVHQDFLRVNCRMTVDQVSRLAIAAPAGTALQPHCGGKRRALFGHCNREGFAGHLHKN